ncbi:F510_1955 family glycosylhydrolase [Planomicrobium sp. CPCC 101079]|uniref:F510_1955 family glycosylhydrolase n=1 Tax=Planomicrobium sp. CPCC 101079 TaxID=2599618 RepID=UPI0011B35A4B|nr:hypothetical protein [Planomicrobium sp. CPCC 101079]TWT09262.1 hypothetical protein FQV28_06405 [Planomicrobium sp. CPCC 101079]
MRKKRRLAGILLAMFVLTGCNSDNSLSSPGSQTASESFEVAFDGELSHVHGMGYAGNNGGLYFASHSGLKIYRDGKWLETADNFHDYMGFNAVDKGFYTSGHPSANSDLPNPLGIQRSLDGGKTLEEISFEGETDFHAMAVGYNSHDILLINPAKNSLLEKGIYKSGNGGETWEPVKAAGLTGEVTGLALHPEDSAYVAAATSTGIYFSSDAGANFRPITKDKEIGTAVAFTKDHLYFGSFGTTASLIKYTIENEEMEKLKIPELKEDGIAFIAQNPEDDMELAIYTIQGDTYLSDDRAKSWKTLR